MYPPSVRVVCRSSATTVVTGLVIEQLEIRPIATAVPSAASLTRFEVALCVPFRANGPAVYLAQPEGLGIASET